MSVPLGDIISKLPQTLFSTSVLYFLAPYQLTYTRSHKLQSTADIAFISRGQCGYSPRLWYLISQRQHDIVHSLESHLRNYSEVT